MSPLGSCTLSRRPLAAEAKLLPQFVRAGWVCVSVAVLPLLSPNPVLGSRYYQLHVIMMNSGFIL